MTTYRRVTTLVKAAADQSGLVGWRQAVAAQGLMTRDDLRAGFAAAWPHDRRAAYGVLREAESAGDGDRSRNLGTAIHAFLERVNAGELDVADVPGEQRPHVEAWLRLKAEHGVQVNPRWSERVVVSDQWQVAGTADLLAVRWQGRQVVADYKTGRSMDYGQAEIAGQLACYAAADRVWAHRASDVDRDRFGRYQLPAADAEDEWDAMPELDQTVGLVIHIPADDPGRAALYEVDLEAGRVWLDVCAGVLDARRVCGRALGEVGRL